MHRPTARRSLRRWFVITVVALLLHGLAEGEPGRPELRALTAGIETSRRSELHSGNVLPHLRVSRYGSRSIPPDGFAIMKR